MTTALQRGTVNTRWRDFADLYLLSGLHPVEGAELQGAIAEVAAFRHAELLPLADVLNGYATRAQSRWVAWRRKQGLADRLPSSFLELLGAVIAFTDPALTGTAANSKWDPRTRRWS
ncbi:nucleotidyl transferase AbiEii/AbiGii toxin family protein [Actinopolymorpha sp. NPDC004070]|uniref:nucleotidyl transferase AbiEii/AbiGii toxin family protein n=1 Tax=Actinopolymorpha sp. NPDC004070 TaxID=3154548 RepID=UPI0033A75756